MSNDAETAPKSEEELLKIIGAGAYCIHLSCSEELTCDLPTIGQWVATQEKAVDYLIVGYTVQFTSIEARNRIVAAYKYTENREALTHNTRGGLVLRTISGVARLVRVTVLPVDFWHLCMRHATYSSSQQAQLNISKHVCLMFFTPSSLRCLILKSCHWTAS